MCNFVFSFRKQVEPEVFRSEPSFLEYNKEIIVFSPKLSISQVALVVKNPPASVGDIRDSGFDSWVGKIPWRKTCHPTPVFLPGEFHGQRSLVGYSPYGHRELDMT